VTTALEIVVNIAISIITIIAGFALPQCIKVKGEPINVSQKTILGILVVSIIFILSSGIIGFPIDLRDHQSSASPSSQNQNNIDIVGDDNNIIINNGTENDTAKSNSSDASTKPSEDLTSDFSEQESEHPNEDIEIGMPFVESLSDNQSTDVSLANWDEENDRDITGNTYHDYTIKFIASDMLNSILGYGESDFNANVHIPFGGKAAGTWYLRVFAVKDMVGNGSSAEVTIFADKEEVYPAFTLISSTTDEMRFPIELDGVRDVVLHFEGKAIGSGYCAGISIEGAVRS